MKCHFPVNATNIFFDKYEQANVGKKVTGKKVTEKKVTDLGRKKSHRKKVTKRIMFFLNLWIGINIFIFIITVIITLCFVWINVLAFLCPT